MNPTRKGGMNANGLYSFPAGPIVVALGLRKVNSPNWDFTFSDIADDLTAIYNAVGHFTEGIPQMHIDVYRYRNGEGGSTFLASEGGIQFGVGSVTANVSVA